MLYFYEGTCMSNDLLMFGFLLFCRLFRKTMPYLPALNQGYKKTRRCSRVQRCELSLIDFPLAQRRLRGPRMDSTPPPLMHVVSYTMPSLVARCAFEGECFVPLSWNRNSNFVNRVQLRPTNLDG